MIHLIVNVYKYISVFLLFIFNFVNPLLASPPLTEPLKEIYADKEVSKDDLTNTEKNLLMSNLYGGSLDWLDNEHIIYNIDKRLEKFNVEDGTLTFLAKGTFLKVSPNSEWIAFIDNIDEENQIFLIRKDGSQKRQLAYFKGVLSGIDNYGMDYDYGMAWSADSTRLALFVNPDEPLDLSEIKSPPSPSTVQIINIETGELRKVYSNSGSIRNLSWYSDSTKLLMTLERRGSLFQDNENVTIIQSLFLDDGKVSILKRFNGLQQSLKPELSPDGLQVSLLYNAECDIYDYMPSLGIIKSDTFNTLITQLTFDLKLKASKWSKDGQTLFVLRNYGAFNQIYTVNAKTREVNQITNGPVRIAKFALSPDGSKLVWIGFDCHGSSVVRMANVDGSNTKDLMIKPAYKESVSMSEVREIEWETLDYPCKMRGLLFLPKNYKEGIRYPLIVDIHGGGVGASIFLAGAILNDTTLEWQLWTNKGYAVFIPEFRSSAAFGFLAILRDEFQEHDLINRDIIDILAGVDYLVKQGIVDSDRMAAIGHSAGGRRANWLTVSSHKFKAIISKEGWADECEKAMDFPIIWNYFGGSPLEVPENYQKNSALFHAKKGTTPTLFLMGNPKLGGADPHHTVHQLYEALRENGVETEYIEYLDEGHNLLLTKNRKDALNRIVNWIDHYFATDSQ